MNTSTLQAALGPFEHVAIASTVERPPELDHLQPNLAAHPWQDAEPEKSNTLKPGAPARKHPPATSGYCTVAAEEVSVNVRPLPTFLTRVLHSSTHAERALAETAHFLPAYLRWELVRRQRASVVMGNLSSLYTGFEGFYAGFKLTPPEVIENLAAHAGATLKCSQMLGENSARYFRILEGKLISLEDLDQLSAIMGATLSRLSILKYARNQAELIASERFHAQTSVLVLQHTYRVDGAREYTDFLPHPNPPFAEVAALLHSMGLSDECTRNYYFMLLLGKVGHPILRAVLSEC